MKTLIVFLCIGLSMHSVSSQWLIRNKKQYRIFSQRIVHSYQSSEETCAKVGAISAVLSDPDEIEWVKARIPYPPFFRAPYRFYVGARKIGTQFQWNDGVPIPDNSSLWGRRQPGRGDFVFMGSEFSISRKFPLYTTIGILKGGHYLCEKQWPPPTDPPETTQPDTTFDDETTLDYDEEDTTAVNVTTQNSPTSQSPVNTTFGTTDSASNSTDEVTGAGLIIIYSSGSGSGSGEDNDLPDDVSPDIFGNYEDTTININGTNSSPPFIIIGAAGGGAILIIIASIAVAIVKRSKEVEAVVTANDSSSGSESIPAYVLQPTISTVPTKRVRKKSIYFRAKALASHAKMNVFSRATLYVDPASQMDMV